VEGCGFRDLQSEFDARGAAVLGVSFDTAQDNKAFAEKFSFTYPLLCDRDRTMGLAYGAATEPGVGGYAGRVGVVIGPDGRVLSYEASVDAGNFPRQALDLVG